MKKEKTKQIVLIIIAFTCMGIGFLNFESEYESVEVVAENQRNEIHLGDVQLVNSEVSDENNYKIGIVENDENYKSDIVSNEDIINENSNQKNAESIEMTEDDNQYFAETKLEREKMYSQMLETYQKMLEKTEIGETQKAIASQEIKNINDNKNGIMISENLIKNKGFEDVVILVNNGVVSVVVKTSFLNQEEIAKIQNIVSRELKIDIENIHISKK